METTCHGFVVVFLSLGAVILGAVTTLVVVLVATMIRDLWREKL